MLRPIWGEIAGATENHIFFQSHPNNQTDKCCGPEQKKMHVFFQKNVFKFINKKLFKNINIYLCFNDLFQWFYTVNFVLFHILKFKKN